MKLATRWPLDDLLSLTYLSCPNQVVLSITQTSSVKHTCYASHWPSSLTPLVGRWQIDDLTSNSVVPPLKMS